MAAAQTARFTPDILKICKPEKFFTIPVKAPHIPEVTAAAKLCTLKLTTPLATPCAEK